MSKEGVEVGPTVFRETMDSHSLTIERGREIIGYLGWHKGKPPRVVLNTNNLPLLILPIDLLKDIVRKNQEIEAGK